MYYNLCKCSVSPWIMAQLQCAIPDTDSILSFFAMGYLSYWPMAPVHNSNNPAIGPCPHCGATTHYPNHWSFLLILQDRFLISNGMIIVDSTNTTSTDTVFMLNYTLCHCSNCTYAHRCKTCCTNHLVIVCQIQGTSYLPTTPQPCTSIQALLLKHELSSHTGYATVT